MFRSDCHNRLKSTVDFSLDSGLAEARTQPAAHFLPTFDSPWAGLPSTESRPDRALRTDLRDGPELMRLDERRISGRHSWKTVTVKDMYFRRYFLQNTSQKPNVLRYRQLAMQDNASAIEAWSQLSSRFNWWEVPASIRCGRTFARDVTDCYYLDRMDDILRSIDTLPPRYSPLFADPPMGQWWNAFRMRPNFVYERFVRNKYGLLVPYDTYETMYYVDEDYKAVFPKSPAWLEGLDIPAGVPLPLPPVLCYYHTEMVEKPGQPLTQKTQRLWAILKMEFMVMFCAFWYKEAIRGGRLFLVNRQTDATLERCCTGMHWKHGEQSSELFLLMASLHKLTDDKQNIMTARGLIISSSVYYHAFHGTGQVNNSLERGQVTYLPKDSRRIKLAVRQQRRMEDRRSTLITLTLHPQHIAKVEGLPDFIRAKRWDMNAALTVKALIYLLYDTASRTTSTVVQMEREVERVSTENESLKAFTNGSAVQPRPLYVPSEDTKQQNDNREPERSDRHKQYGQDDGVMQAPQRGSFRSEWNEWVGTGRDARTRYQSEGIGYSTDQASRRTQWEDMETRGLETSDGRRRYGYHDVAGSQAQVRPREWTSPRPDSMSFRRSRTGYDY